MGEETNIPVSVSNTPAPVLTLADSLPEDDRHLQPLGLPRGSIRAILALLFSLVVMASFFFPSVVLPEYFLDFWFAIVGYYLGYRTDNTAVKKII